MNCICVYSVYILYASVINVQYIIHKCVCTFHKSYFQLFSPFKNEKFTSIINQGGGKKSSFASLRGPPSLFRRHIAFSVFLTLPLLSLCPYDLILRLPGQSLSNLVLPANSRHPGMQHLPRFWNLQHGYPWGAILQPATVFVFSFFQGLSLIHLIHLKRKSLPFGGREQK